MVEIVEYDAASARLRADGLARLLQDCVEGGASISFMWPFGLEDAHAFWVKVFDALEAGTAHLYVAELEGEVVGAVQLWLDVPPNQPHRGDVRKLLVHRSARRKGIARRLMGHLEAEAPSYGLSLLVLDTVTGGAAEPLYASIGWSTVGVIPNYALWPDGRYCDTTVFYKAF